MSSSCGELGLRIALCDLIERLKRCEQKCSYLEECRHELIKEVMRLKLENEWLTNTCRNNNLMSESNHLALNSNPFNNSYNNNNNNNFMIRSINELKSENKSIDKTIEYNLNGSDSDNKDESWQQITVRLLQDMKRDIANGQNGYTVDPQQAYGTLPITDLLESDSEDKFLTNKNKETIITINDSLTHSDETLLDDKNYLLIKRQKQSKTSTPMENMAIIGNSGYNPYSLDSCDDRIKDQIFNNRSEKVFDEQNFEQKRNANHLSLFENNPIDNNIEKY